MAGMMIMLQRSSDSIIHNTPNAWVGTLVTGTLHGGSHGSHGLQWLDIGYDDPVVYDTTPHGLAHWLLVALTCADVRVLV